MIFNFESKILSSAQQDLTDINLFFVLLCIPTLFSIIFLSDEVGVGIKEGRGGGEGECGQLLESG